MIEIVCWIEGLPVSKEEEEEEECARGIQVEFRLRESVLFFLVPQREKEREREKREMRSHIFCGVWHFLASVETPRIVDVNFPAFFLK